MSNKEHHITTAVEMNQDFSKRHKTLIIILVVVMIIVLPVLFAAATLLRMF
jgi:flagellar basal body-associated protein FliL